MIKILKILVIGSGGREHTIAKECKRACTCRSSSGDTREMGDIQVNSPFFGTGGRQSMDCPWPRMKRLIWWWWDRKYPLLQWGGR